jgi:hypothetical protein
MSKTFDMLEKEVECLNNLQEACEIFDHLFPKIVSIRSSPNVIDNSEQKKYDVAAFTLEKVERQQRELIKHMSGFLLTALNASQSLLNLKKEAALNGDSSSSSGSTINDNFDEKYNNMEKLMMEKSKLEIKNNKTIATLQEFLVLELNRNEKLEETLKAKEIELVNVTVERNKLEKSSNGSQGLRSSSSDYAVEKAKSKDQKDRMEAAQALYNNPMNVLGMYVRKSFGSSFFFGLIVSYEVPYYKVYYIYLYTFDNIFTFDNKYHHIQLTIFLSLLFFYV